jgi:hypothetical protein
MQRFVPAALAAMTFVAAPAWADKLPLPKASYSADVLFFTKGKEFSGHINVDGPKERRQARNAAGVDTTIIIRRDQGKVYDLKPKRHLAVGLRIAAAEAAGDIGAAGTDVDTFYGTDAESQGPETIDGLLTTKYAIKIDGGPDLVVNATVWATDDGIIVKVIGKTSIDADKPPSRMELKNIVRGPQDASLFELPPGMELLTAGNEGDNADKPTAAVAPVTPAEAPAPITTSAPAAAAPQPATPVPAALPNK